MDKIHDYLKFGSKSRFIEKFHQNRDFCKFLQKSKFLDNFD